MTTPHRVRRAMRPAIIAGLLTAVAVAMGGTVGSGVVTAGPGGGGKAVVTGSSDNKGDSGNKVCNGSPRNQVCTERLEVSVGTSQPMLPTIPVTVPVTVSNSRNQAVRLVQVTIDELGDATNRSCPASNVVVVGSKSLAGTTLAPSGRATVSTPPLTMRADAPESCQGAVFPISVTVTGVRE